VKKSKRLKLSDFMAFHMELALNEAPIYKNDMTLRERWFVEFVDDYNIADYSRVYDDLVYGERPIKAPLIMCPTALDQGTRCPEGKHILYVYLFAAHDLKEGAEHWDNVKEETEDKLLELLNRRTTNMTSDNILGKWSMSPLDYARYNPSWPKGDFAHFQSNIIQQGANRPFPGWSNYKTPIDKLYLVGCSTHPGWAVSGAARTGMYTVFEELGMDFEDMMVK
jgi:phytoene dehydrogenase-like protein